VTFYLIALTAGRLVAIAPLWASDSPLRDLRLLPMLAVYPLVPVMAWTEGLRVAGLWWIALTGVGVVLVMADNALRPRAERGPLLEAVWKTALLWPLVVPLATESLLIRLGILSRPAEPRLPEPPRGAELTALSDDEMLVAAHQILSGQADLTGEERTILVAETFNREVHGGGFSQWLANTESSLTDTVQALRTVDAHATASLLQRAADAVPATWSETQPLDVRLRALEPIEPVLRSLTDSFFSIEREEDLTSLIARFVRQNRSRCPALA
jgi:hypothetical protein